MDFIMPNSKNNISIVLFLILTFAGIKHAMAENFKTTILHGSLISTEKGYVIDTEIEYQLSPLAKEALEKGVALTWDIKEEIRKSGFLWTPVIYKKKIRYTLRYHALLNQYEVITPHEPPEMFLTLRAALRYMATPRSNETIKPEILEPSKHYQLAIRCRFNRELLPAPIRPFTYLNPQWFLSSDWSKWSISK